MMQSEFFAAFLLHSLGGLALLAGVVFLFAYFIRHLSAANLKKWGIILFSAGAVACLLSLAWGKHMRNEYSGKGGHREMGGMMKHMEDGMEDGVDGMSMDMWEMQEMLEGKTGDDFDKAFIEMMIPHHQGALDMARLAETSAKHQEIKDLAKAIIAGQTAEIGKMQQWMEAWGYNK